MSRFHLSPEQRRMLRAQLCSTDDVDVYRRTLALLEVDGGRSPATVSQSMGVSCSSVYNWVNAFVNAQSLDALADHRGQGRSSVWTESLEGILSGALLSAPNVFGYQEFQWTVPLLQEYLHRQGGRWLSEPTIRRKLHEKGYVWGTSGYVLNERARCELQAQIRVIHSADPLLSAAPILRAS